MHYNTCLFVIYLFISLNDILVLGMSISYQQPLVSKGKNYIGKSEVYCEILDKRKKSINEQINRTEGKGEKEKQ